jgi:hypothetical protein
MFVGNGAFCVNHALLDFADGLQGRMWPIVKRAACEEHMYARVMQTKLAFKREEGSSQMCAAQAVRTAA